MWFRRLRSFREDFEIIRSISMQKEKVSLLLKIQESNLENGTFPSIRLSATHISYLCTDGSALP